MVEFGSGYYHPLDRGYGHADHEHTHGFPASGGKETSDVGVGIGDLGISMGLGPVPNVQAIAAKLRPGTKKLEFVFTGAGKGSGQGQTPEMYGKKQRQALVEVARANRVDFTTHSTIGVYGLAGMDKQGNFSKASKDFSLQEVKRAIEFAADVGFGGPVVVHTGEFSRPIVDAEWNIRPDDPFKERFQMFEGEEGRTSFRVVDTRSGGVVAEARKNRDIAKPVWKRYEPGDEIWEEHSGKDYQYVDEQGETQTVTKGNYIDYQGKKLDAAQRIPQFDKEKGEFKITQMGWKELEEEAKEMTERAREEWKRWRAGKLTKNEKSKSKWKRFLDEEYDTINKVKLEPEEAYVISTLETNAANSRGLAIYYGGNFDENLERMRKLEKAKEFYKKLEETTSEGERWKLKLDLQKSGLGGLVPEEAKLPTQWIDQEIKHIKHSMSYAQESSAGQWAQAKEAEETIANIESAEKYALREAYDAYAQAAITAWRQSDKLAKEGKLKKPITVALENMFPEQYGSHPDELIKLVKGSQEKMAQLLQKDYHISEQEARKKAQQHITSTFDTGHLNMWRKYWKSDPAKTLEQNDKEFDNWVLKKVGEMIDKKIIGHVHLDDNYGYQDDHLAPGEGNNPIREIVQMLKQKGYTGEMIIEPGADYTTDVTGFHSVMKTWRHFGIPVYGKGSGLAPRRTTWSQVGYGYFGQTEPPYFTFGGYSPSEDWTLWSGVPLE